MSAERSGRGPLRVGLTGGIGSGKSTVAALLRAHGLPVVDADEIVHELLAPGGAAVPPVLAAFGDAVRAPDGGVDRKALGRIVFGDAAARRRLEAIVHPLVAEASRERLRTAAERSPGGVVVYDAALLVETGRYEEFDRLVVVTAPREAQIARIAERDGLSRKEAEARVAAQMPLEEKVRLADYVIDNGGPPEKTAEQTRHLVRRLLEDAAALAAGLPLPKRK
ncbi:MAG: dephospho-CoA kinase [Acidobacteria bacterium]|nr:MAG: dephospho-CoA kinase [Acidobacteriota bacterium]